MADLGDIKQFSGALRELGQLLPTQPLMDYQRAVSAVGIATTTSSEQIKQLTDDIEEFTEGTNMSRTDLARYTAEFVSGTNKMVVSTREFQRIAQITSQTDPFNTEIRIRQLDNLARKYGAFTAGLASDTKRQETALKAMQIAVHDGDEGLANYYLRLSRGVTAQTQFTSNLEKVGKTFNNVRSMMAGWVTDSKLVNGALDALSNKWVAFTAIAGAAGFGGYELVKGASSLKKAVGNLASGNIGGGGVASAETNSLLTRILIVEEEILARMGGVSMGPAPSGVGGRGASAGGSVGAAAIAGAGSVATKSLFSRILGRAAYGLPALAFGAYDIATSQPGQERSHAVGSTVGGVAGSILGSFGGPIGTVLGGLIGAKIGDIIADKISGVTSKKPKPDDYDKDLDARETAIAEGRRGIKQAQRGFALAKETYDPEGAQERSLNARQALAGQMQGLGMTGPGAGLAVAQQQIARTEGLIKSITAEHEDYIHKVGLSQEAINKNTQEFETIIAGLRGEQLNQVQTARRSILEQFTASAINAPNGTYTMPGGLSDRQKYGGSYYENMPLVDITNRPRQPKYQDMAASFQPIINTVMSSMRGHAGGGLIPGAPSSRDNTISAVASGEYVINAGAVQHYGPGVFDALNRKAAPKFAGGGFWSNLWTHAKERLAPAPDFLPGNQPGGRQGGTGISFENVVDRIVAKIDPLRDEMNRREGGKQANSIGDEMMRIQGIGGKKFENMPPDQLAKYAYGVLKQETAADMRKSVGAVAGVIAGIPPKYLENKMAADVIANHAKGSRSETHFLNAALHPQEALPALPEVEFIRNPRFQHHWQPGFGTSPLHMGRLGGKTHNLTHRYFEDDIFNGGGRVSAGRHIGHDSKAQSGDVQLVIKEIRTAASTIVQGFRGFTSNLANS